MCCFIYFIGVQQIEVKEIKQIEFKESMFAQSGTNQSRNIIREAKNYTELWLQTISVDGIPPSFKSKF